MGVDISSYTCMKTVRTNEKLAMTLVRDFFEHFLNATLN